MGGLVWGKFCVCQFGVVIEILVSEETFSFWSFVFRKQRMKACGSIKKVDNIQKLNVTEIEQNERVFVFHNGRFNFSFFNGSGYQIGFD